MRPMEIVYSVGMAVVGVVSAYSAFQTSRLDTAFNAIGEIKVQVTATGKDVEYLRRDMDEVRDAVQLSRLSHLHVLLKVCLVEVEPERQGFEVCPDLPGAVVNYLSVGRNSPL